MPLYLIQRLSASVTKAPVLAALACAFVVLSVGAGPASRGANVRPLVPSIARMAGAPNDFAWECSANLHQMVIATTYLRERRVVLAPKLCRWLTERQTDPRRFGIAVHVVVHEASHTRGLHAENAAEDRAQLLTPRILARLLHGRAVESALRGAAWYHRQLPWRYLVRVEQPHFTTGTSLANGA